MVNNTLEVRAERLRREVATLKVPPCSSRV